MKPLIFLLVIFLVGGTPVAQRKQEQKAVMIIPVQEKILFLKQREITDSMERDFINAAEESDRKTLLLIAEKLKADKENLFLRKENARLRQELKKIDTVYIAKPNFLKRWFPKKKKHHGITNP